MILISSFYGAFALGFRLSSSSFIVKTVSLLSRKLGLKWGTNAIPKGKLANHLFKGTGKLIDNPANRSLISKISNGKPLGVDQYGKAWYTGVDGAGRSVYTYALLARASCS